MKTRKPPRRLLSREPATIDRAVGQAAQGRNLEGSAALIFCTRVGSADFVPPRYNVAYCSKCGSPAWLSGDVVEATERRGMNVVVICFQCVEDRSS